MSGRREPSPLVDGPGDRPGQPGDEGRRGHGQKEDHLQRIRERAPDRRRVVQDHEPRERGQGDRADGDAEEAERQVHDPEGVIEPTDAALGQRGHEDGIDKDVDARPGEADRDGDEESHDPAEFGVAEAQDGAPTETPAADERHLDEELHQPADEDAHGHAEDGLLAAGDVPAVGQERDEDGEDVEDGRGHGGHEERPLRIEIAHGPGGQTDEEQEREEDGGQLGGQVDLARYAPETEGDGLGQKGRGDKPRDREEARDDEENVENVGGQAVLGLPAFGLLGREDGDEGIGERRLGEEVAQEIRDAEGHVEGVRGRADAEEVGKDRLADEAHDPADGRTQGERADAPRDVFHAQAIIRYLRPAWQGLY